MLHLINRLLKGKRQVRQNPPTKRKRLKAHKRHVLLLEVLISFMLIAMCIIPLIQPHAYILIAQTKFIHKIELDHLVNLIYADIVERLYINDIPWNDIMAHRELEIDENYLKSIGYEKIPPFKGKYRLKDVRVKPNKDAAYALYLLGLDIKFAPVGEKEVDEDGEVLGTLKYHYDLFVIRDLGTGDLPQGENEDEPKG